MLTPLALSRMAANLYSDGPLTFRALQRYRPYICPFEELIAEVPKCASILDIGCGGGLFLGLLNAVGLKPNGTGFDASAPAISLAKSMAAKNLDFRHMDATAPWPDKKFDVVAMIDVIHHVRPSQQERTIRRACRHVKPGGLFLYKDMVQRPLWRALANRIHDLVLARQWIHYAPVDDVERWAKSEGLRVERAEQINRLWYGHDLRVFKAPSSAAPAGA